MFISEEEFYAEKLLADKGDAAACDRVAFAYQNGDSFIKVEKDIPAAILYFQKAAQLGYAEAYYSLYWIYCMDKWGVRDPEKEKIYLEKSVAAGVPNAFGDLAAKLMHGFTYGDSTLPKQRQAFQLYKKYHLVAAQNDGRIPKSTYLYPHLRGYPLCLAMGVGCIKQPQNAYEALIDLAQKKYPGAHTFLLGHEIWEQSFDRPLWALDNAENRADVDAVLAFVTEEDKKWLTLPKKKEEEITEEKPALVSLATMNDIEKNGNTRLLNAIENKDAALAKNLIALGADVNIKGHRPRETFCLVEALFFGDEEIFDALLNAGADVNMVVGADDNTVLQAAAMTGKETLVKKIINHGANIAWRDKKGKTAYDYAVEKGYSALFDLLRITE